MPVHRDSRQCEDAHVDAEHLDERTEGAHEVGQVPPLQQRRLELWEQTMPLIRLSPALQVW
jgi:hypothetical protein